MLVTLRCWYTTAAFFFNGATITQQEDEQTVEKNFKQRNQNARRENEHVAVWRLDCDPQSHQF